MSGFGELLREARICAKLTQKELAKIVPTDHTYISKMEKGLFLPARKLALGLADALGITDKDARNTFLLAAGVLNQEDVQGFALVEVARPETPGELQPAADQKFEELKAEVQAIKAELGEVKETLTEINFALREFFSSQTSQQEPERKASQTSPRPSHPKAQTLFATEKVRRIDTSAKILETMTLGAGVGKRIMHWMEEEDKRRKMKQAQAWEEEWTKIVEEEGNLYIVMTGFQGMTFPLNYYLDLAKPILDRGGEEAEFIRHAITGVERRQAAFERQVRNRKNRFRHIMPINALTMYKKTGFYRPDEWTRIYKGNPASLEQQAEHLRRIIHFLQYPNYQLGFYTGEDAKSDLFKHVFWEIKGGHTVFLERLKGEYEEEDFIIKYTRHPEVVRDFRRHFIRLWRSKEVIKDKKIVKSLLETHIDSLV